MVGSGPQAYGSVGTGSAAAAAAAAAAQDPSLLNPGLARARLTLHCSDHFGLYGLSPSPSASPSPISMAIFDSILV